MRELRIVEVRVSGSSTPPVVVLRELEGERLLPIWTTAQGATAILTAAEDPDPSRPAVHDLVGDLLTALGSGLTEARIVAYDAGEFYAELLVGEHTLAVRPSDAIALAIRAGCPIRCAEDVLDAAAVREQPDPVEIAPGEQAEVEKFREFLDSVNPDDF